MKKIISRKSFMEKLRFYLSFYYNDEESTVILNDYEEWFDNEALQGKSEAEICAALNSPKKTVSNLLLESDRNSDRIRILFQNTMIQVILLIMINILISILVLRTCNKYASNYLYFACGIIFIDFITGMLLVKKNPSHKLEAGRSVFYRCNLFLFVFSMAVIVFELFFLPGMKNPNSGEICFFILSAFILIFVLVNIFLVIKKIFQAEQLACFTTLHTLGTVTLLFYITNQLHRMHQDMSEFLSSVVFGSIGIYIETIVLCFIFLYTKKIREMNKYETRG